MLSREKLNQYSGISNTTLTFTRFRPIVEVHARNLIKDKKRRELQKLLFSQISPLQFSNLTLFRERISWVAVGRNWNDISFSLY